MKDLRRDHSNLPEQPVTITEAALQKKSLKNKELESLGSWHDPHLVAEEADYPPWIRGSTNELLNDGTHPG